MRTRVIILYLLTALLTSGSIKAQQFTMKGGVIWSKMFTGEIEGKIDPLLNYYYEANYCYRFGTGKFWSIGFGYLGSGGTISDSWATTYIREIVDHYEVKTRFSNFIIPVKVKFSTEHRAHPRFYGFAGYAPAIMFDESRTVNIIYQPAYVDRPLPRGLKDLFDFHPKRIQGYVLLGIGGYYRHIVMDVSAMVNTFNVYEEYVSPVSFNAGVIATLGVQISRASNKRW